ncbi:MAG: transcription termination factor NusA [Firmicutes bacterium]|nr:transcription termination factor NusA [Bacillota bacterium]
MNGDFIEALRAIEKEKEIPFKVLVETIESALVTAYKKNFAATGDIRVRVEFSKGGFKVFCEKTVVDKVNNPHAEISLAEAHTLNSSLKLGDVIEVEVTPKDFGRIAAQTAKQVVVQRIREAERDKIFEEFSERIGEVMTGTVQRHEQKNVFISLGKVEALLPPNEQVPTEPYKFNDRIKVYILDVRRTPKGPQVIVSRTHPSLIRRLFELEVPEIHDGVVTIKSVAREPGARSKIAVASNDEKVDPVGACVGHRGSRVQAIVNELYDEKIDIVRWDENPSKFIAEALSPAKVISVEANEETMSAFVVVPDNQLSLAIGKAGQNVRLAARLTGWRIDIKSESQVARAALTVELPEEEKSGVEESLTEAAETEEYMFPEGVEEKLITQEGKAAVEEEVQLEEEEPSEEAVEAVAEAIVYQGESGVEDTPQEQEPEDNEMAST